MKVAAVNLQVGHSFRRVRWHSLGGLVPRDIFATVREVELHEEGGLTVTHSLGESHFDDGDEEVLVKL